MGLAAGGVHKNVRIDGCDAPAGKMLRGDGSPASLFFALMVAAGCEGEDVGGGRMLRQ